ncbi:RBBP9/YdeN family alpha/beta hydrolase [Rodentibacter caecimuris]|uniref:Esterase n=1 Tax=Rodentibacter caecimuris TaxID=1796644 RepID=A0ABX3KY99_9PAST|nr:esterase [Rodentibacter heylii]
MKNVYIVHGYTASPNNHWFPWLKQQLSQYSINCECLTMPESSNPTPDKWLAYLELHTKINANTVLVGHSLGCVAIMNLLAKHCIKPAGAVFVSGFYQVPETLPMLTSFIDFYSSLPSLPNFKSYVVSAMDDDIVPHKYSSELSIHLSADYIRLSQGGHFLDREGWSKFPLVLELILKCFDK